MRFEFSNEVDQKAPHPKSIPAQQAALPSAHLADALSAGCCEGRTFCVKWIGDRVFKGRYLIFGSGVYSGHGTAVSLHFACFVGRMPALSGGSVRFNENTYPCKVRGWGFWG